MGTAAVAVVAFAAALAFATRAGLMPEQMPAAVVVAHAFIVVALQHRWQRPPRRLLPSPRSSLTWSPRHPVLYRQTRPSRWSHCSRRKWQRMNLAKRMPLCNVHSPSQTHSHSQCETESQSRTRLYSLQNPRNRMEKKEKQPVLPLASLKSYMIATNR